MDEFEKMAEAFEKQYGDARDFAGNFKEYLMMFVAFAQGWEAKPVNKMGRPKKGSVPKGKKAKKES